MLMVAKPTFPGGEAMNLTFTKASAPFKVDMDNDEKKAEWENTHNALKVGISPLN